MIRQVLLLGLSGYLGQVHHGGDDLFKFDIDILGFDIAPTGVVDFVPVLLEFCLGFPDAAVELEKIIEVVDLSGVLLDEVEVELVLLDVLEFCDDLLQLFAFLGDGGQHFLGCLGLVTDRFDLGVQLGQTVFVSWHHLVHLVLGSFFIQFVVHVRLL